MRSSKRLPSIASLWLLVLASGCATKPQDAAYRMRLEAGVSTPEDQVRYRTSPAQWDQATSGAHDLLPLQWSLLDQQLFTACAVGDVDAVKNLINKGARVNAEDPLGNTPLIVAARGGQLAVARTLLSAGADPGKASGMNTPLAEAALQGHAQMVRLLVGRGASVNARGMNAKSPLLIAVEMNQIPVVDVLVRAGADLSVRADSGESLLMVALNANQPAMLQTLLRSSANPNVHDADGLTPLYWAKLLKRPEMESALLAAGAKPDMLRVVVRKSESYVSGEY